MESIAWIIIYKISCLALAGLCIYLGYKLYAIGITDKGTNVDASGNGYKFKMVNAAPGTMFALFGALIACATIVQGLENRESFRTTVIPENTQPTLPEEPLFQE